MLAARNAEQSVAAEPVPRADVLRRRRAQAVGVGRRVLEVRDPPLELQCRHLGVELDAPARVAETERLRRPVGAGELDRARGDVVRVLVPHEPGEAARHRAEHGIGDAGLVQDDVDPADLRLVEPPHLRAGGAREQLHAEADAEHRPPVGDERLEPRDLLRDPRVHVLLVGMHRAAEDEIRVVRVDRPRRLARPREAPLVEDVAAVADHGLEQLRPSFRPVHHRQHPHALRSVRNWKAFVAAWETRPSGFCGSCAVALLLKSANTCCAWPASSCNVGTHSASSSSEYR